MVENKEIVQKTEERGRKQKKTKKNFYMSHCKLLKRYFTIILPKTPIENSSAPSMTHPNSFKDIKQELKNNKKITNVYKLYPCKMLCITLKCHFLVAVTRA